MKTPIIIPAYNEELNIKTTLDSLPADLVEPYVMVNGSTDKTAQIAELTGAKVFDLAEQGRLPAVQYGLRQLGKLALEPLFMIDADTKLQFSHRWYTRMLSSLEPASQTPIAVAGPIWFTPNPEGSGNRIAPITRSLVRLSMAMVSSKRARSTGAGGGQYGPNLGLHINNSDTLDRILSLEHLWPREDVAVVKAITHDGEGIYKQILNLDALALTPESDVYEPLISWFKYGLNLKRGIEATNEIVRQKYINRAAPGSKPNDEP